MWPSVVGRPSNANLPMTQNNRHTQVLGVYTMLEAFLPAGSMEKEEVDKITVRCYVYMYVLCCVLRWLMMCVLLSRQTWMGVSNQTYAYTQSTYTKRTPFYKNPTGATQLLEAASQAGGGPHRRTLPPRGTVRRATRV